MGQEVAFTVKMTCEEINEGALIERYVGGVLSDTEAEALEAHYLTCDRCQSEISLAAAIREGLAEERSGGAEPAVASEMAGGAASGPPVTPIRQPRMARRLTAGAVGAVAVAAVMAGVLILRSPDTSIEPPAHRDEALDVEAAPALQAPVGEVASLTEFRWSAVSAADLYRVRIYDAEGLVLWETEIQATQVAPAAALQLEPGAQYLWEVEARVGFDRWVSSELVRFRIIQP